jgi:hypothetical protein
MAFEPIMTMPLRACALLLLMAACAPVRRPAPADMSGFLDDYRLLRPGGPEEATLVYRNPDARWTAYDKVLLEPVTLWRSGRHSLAPVREEDLMRLVSLFEATVRRRLGQDFPLVDRPGPGVLRIRLGITEARASDPVLDVLTAHGDTRMPPPARDALDDEMRRFVGHAAIEGEIRDAETGALLAQGVQRRRREGARPLATWSDVERVLSAWTERLCERLEARTGRR